MFSFSFCKGEVFDIQNTKSEVGIFTEYIRNLNSSVRSLHGITSFSAIGNDAKNLMSMSDKTSYGPGSIPSNLRKANGKILQIAPFCWNIDAFGESRPDQSILLENKQKSTLYEKRWNNPRNWPISLEN